MYAEQGLFIVFEGGDGVGKSTQVRRLAAWLQERTQDVVLTHEPGDSVVGHRIRELVLDPASGSIDPRAEALLYAADKAQHLHEVVRPALARGAVVICDRYVDSMVAYQGAGRVLSEEDIATVAGWATGHLRPHLTILLDCDPVNAVGRKGHKDRLERESIEFHNRVRQGFLRLAQADPEHYLVLRGREDRDEIAANIAAAVEPLFHQRIQKLSDPTDTMDA